MAESILDEYETRMIAEETMVGDLVHTCLDELKAAPDVWQKLSEDKQADVLERLEKRVKAAISRAVMIIASDDRPTLTADIEQITVKDGYKAVLKVSRNDPGALDLVEAQAQGMSDVLIVLPNVAKYRDQQSDAKPDPDQPGLELDDEDAPGNVVDFKGKEDPLLQNAISHVVESRKCSISSVQRAIKVGYNRAAHLVERMEELGIVSPMNDRGTRDILTGPKPTDNEQAQEIEDEQANERALDMGIVSASELDQEGREPDAVELDIGHPIRDPYFRIALDFVEKLKLNKGESVHPSELAEELDISFTHAEALVASLVKEGFISEPDE